ncbi:NAD(P)H-hydrate dehydratase [Variovorax sp. PvP013]|uniref:NAD(P)H-hydrate dehydratase n=1 Tax=Variovorax sp. PvP013 TaxID=3156435 RepID=UPI003D1A0330
MTAPARPRRAAAPVPVTAAKTRTRAPAVAKPAARPIDDAALAHWPLTAPDGAADKETRGHVLVVAGSHEIPGAALLAAVAALRAGAGKLTIAAPERVALGLALAIPEARVIALAENKGGGLLARGCATLESVASRVGAVVLGPGMLDEKRSVAFVRGLLPLLREAVVVLDAYAMSVARDGAFDQPVVLTPHAGEMAHLTGLTKEAVCADPLGAAREAAGRWNACVALKGAETFIVQPGEGAWRFDGGTPGLATSGSGDTLAGLIGGLAARGLSPLQASAWGVLLHARAGHALGRRHGPLGYLARELSAEVPAIIHAIGKKRTAARGG